MKEQKVQGRNRTANRPMDRSPGRRFSGRSGSLPKIFCLGSLAGCLVLGGCGGLQNQKPDLEPYTELTMPEPSHGTEICGPTARCLSPYTEKLAVPVEEVRVYYAAHDGQMRFQTMSLLMTTDSVFRAWTELNGLEDEKLTESRRTIPETESSDEEGDPSLPEVLQLAVSAQLAQKLRGPGSIWNTGLSGNGLYESLCKTFQEIWPDTELRVVTEEEAARQKIRPCYECGPFEDCIAGCGTFRIYWMDQKGQLQNSTLQLTDNPEGVFRAWALLNWTEEAELLSFQYGEDSADLKIHGRNWFGRLTYESGQQEKDFKIRMTLSPAFEQGKYQPGKENLVKSLRSTFMEYLPASEVMVTIDWKAQDHQEDAS